MLNFIVFVISLGILVFSVFMKNLELTRGRKIFLANWFAWSDRFIWRTLNNLKVWWGHINFKNTRLFFLFITNSLKILIIKIKRRFDHKQSHFFTKRGSEPVTGKRHASFFLRHVSEYKKTLREGKDK